MTRSPALIIWLGIALTLGLLLAAFVGGCQYGKRRAVTAVTVDTVVTHTSDTTTVTTVTYRPDPKAAVEIARLTAALDGSTKSLQDLLWYVGELQNDKRVLVDSLTLARLQAAGKALEVSYNRGAVKATTLKGTTVSTWTGRTWGNRWQLFSDGPNGKPMLRQPRWPFALGVEAELRGTTRADSLTPAGAIAAHVTARRGGWLWFAGMGWPMGTEPRIECGLRAAWEF